MGSSGFSVILAKLNIVIQMDGHEREEENTCGCKREAGQDEDEEKQSSGKQILLLMVAEIT